MNNVEIIRQLKETLESSSCDFSYVKIPKELVEEIISRLGGRTNNTGAVIINGSTIPVRTGIYSVAEVRSWAIQKIPREDTLCQMLDGVLVPLNDDDTIEIKGVEIFASGFVTTSALMRS